MLLELAALHRLQPVGGGQRGALRRLAAFASTVIDNRVIDGAVNGTGVVVRATAGRLRRLQSGYVRNYALGIAAGAVAILAYLLARAGV